MRKYPKQFQKVVEFLKSLDVKVMIDSVTYYIEYKIHETVIGRLYAGDWMFVPYNASDGDAEIEVKGLNGINKIEYAMFKTAWTLPAAES